MTNIMYELQLRIFKVHRIIRLCLKQTLEFSMPIISYKKHILTIRDRSSPNEFN